MAMSDTEICNRALVRLAAKTISSLSDSTDRAIACNQAYTSILENELALTPWRFAMKKAQLAQLVDTPVNEWKYAYQLPSDRIGAPFAVFNSSANGVDPMKRYEVFSDRIYTNETQLYYDYPLQVNSCEVEHYSFYYSFSYPIKQ